MDVKEKHDIRFRVVVTKEWYESGWVRREHKKVADTGNERDDGPQYDWVDTSCTKDFTREVLNQQVDTLDLVTVIKAVNGIA